MLQGNLLVVLAGRTLDLVGNRVRVLYVNNSSGKGCAQKQCSTSDITFFIEVVQRPENELLLSGSEDYRQTQEELDLLDCSLPALLPGKVRAPCPLHPDCSVPVKELKTGDLSGVSKGLSLGACQSHS